MVPPLCLAHYPRKGQYPGRGPHQRGGPPPIAEEGVEYGVVVDAGSSGSRARVYSWPTRTDPKIVPNITEVRTTGGWILLLKKSNLIQSTCSTV